MPQLIGLSILILSIALLPDGLPSAGLWWDFLIGLGFCAIAIIAFLGWDSESPATNPRLRLHRNLAVLTTLLTVTHALGYLLLDSTLIDYLLPTAPAYMLAGVAAFLSLVVVTVSSFPAPRKRLYRNFPAFRSWHRILFVVILIGSGWHVAGTDFSLPGIWQLLLAGLLLAVLPLAAYIGRRGGSKPVLSRPPLDLPAADRSALSGGAILVLISAGYAFIRQSACAVC